MEKYKTAWPYYLIIFIILIILLIGAAPWIDGVLFKQQVYRLANIVNARNKFKVEIVQYNQGWLHSQVALKVTPVPRKAMLQNIAMRTRPTLASFVVTSEITHGPIIFTRAPFFGVASVASQVTFSQGGLPHANNTIKVNSFVGFANHWSNHVRASSLTIVKPQYGTVHFIGLVGTINFKTAGSKIKRFNSHFYCKTVDIKPDHAISPVAIKVVSVSYDTNGFAVANAPWNTSMHFSAPAVTVTVHPGQSEAEKIYKVKNIKFSTDFGAESTGANQSAQANNHYQMLMNFSAERMMANDQSVAPMSSIHYTFSATGLNGDAILTLVNQLKAAQAQGINATLKAYTIFLPTILTPKSRVTQKFNLNTAKGRVSGDGVLYFPASMKEAPTDILTILRKTNVSANVLMSIPLFDAWFSGLTTPNTSPKATWHTLLLKQLVQGWIDEGYIAKTVSDYAISIERHHGKFKVNGKPLSVIPRPSTSINVNTNANSVPNPSAVAKVPQTATEKTSATSAQ